MSSSLYSKDYDVVISYKRGGESGRVAENIYKCLTEFHHLKVGKDDYDNDLQKVKGSLSTFMEKIQKSGRVILVLSDEYFRSEYCMAELYGIFKRDGWTQRVIPLWVDNTPFYQAEQKDKYIGYWGNLFTHTAEKIDQEPGALKARKEKRNNYEHFRDYIEDILGAFSDWLCRKPEEMARNNWEMIASEIVPSDEAELRNEKQRHPLLPYLVNRQKQATAVIGNPEPGPRMYLLYGHEEESHEGFFRHLEYQKNDGVRSCFFFAMALDICEQESRNKGSKIEEKFSLWAQHFRMLVYRLMRDKLRKAPAPDDKTDAPATFADAASRLKELTGKDEFYFHFEIRQDQAQSEMLGRTLGWFRNEYFATGPTARKVTMILAVKTVDTWIKKILRPKGWESILTTMAGSHAQVLKELESPGLEDIKAWMTNYAQFLKGAEEKKIIAQFGNREKERMIRIEAMLKPYFK